MCRAILKELSGELSREPLKNYHTRSCGVKCGLGAPAKILIYCVLTAFFAGAPSQICLARAAPPRCFNKLLGFFGDKNCAAGCRVAFNGEVRIIRV